jgi:RHS repeat-associated protein
LNLRFPGQYEDVETGLTYNNRRDYNSGTARYQQPDPIGVAFGDLNLYMYAVNNPILFIDLTGLAVGDWWDPHTYTTYLRTYATYWGQFGGGTSDFWNNYWLMREANTIGADKYFHCMANCEATKRGPGGADAASFIGEGREVFDHYIKRDSPQACNEDRAANRTGQKTLFTESCQETCGGYRVPGLNPRF